MLAMSLQPAMSAGAPLYVLDEPVSPKLTSASDTIQEIWSCWRTDLRRVPVASVAADVTRSEGRGRGVACFFSGGVDSFYTLLRRNEAITHIILVHGFDIELEAVELRQRVSTMAGAVAAEAGKELVEVETDLRTFSDAHVGWDVYHGAAFAAVGLLLQNQFERVLIAASHTYNSLFPWGSHPLVDPLWSTERTEFAHDSAEVARPAKVGALAASDLALRSLRVCWRNPKGAYNCGRCEKCLRTMIALQLAGVLEQARTFPELDLEAVAGIQFAGVNDRMFMRENLAAVELRGQDPELAAAMRAALRRDRRRTALRSASRWLRRSG